jgi:hypothetical protein
MAEIQVVFPKTTASGERVEPIVHSVRQPVVREEFIFWNVHCEDYDIRWVKVWFEDDAAEYFPVNGESRNWFKRELRQRTLPPPEVPSKADSEQKTSDTAGDPEEVRRKAQIWGRTPLAFQGEPPSGGPDLLRHKYWVAGYSQEPKSGPGHVGEAHLVAFKDPEIDPITPH